MCDTESKTLEDPMPCSCGLCRGGRKSILQKAAWDWPSLKELREALEEILETSDADAEGVLPQS